MNRELNQSTDFDSGQETSTCSTTTQEIAGKAREAAHNVKEKARETKDKVWQKGNEAAHKLQDQGRSYAQDHKTQLGERIHGYSSAVRRAAEKLREEKDPNIAHYADMVADRLDQAGDYVQARDPGMILRDFEDMARRRPEIFFGGMFVAGLAISRFLKASSQRYEYDAEDESYWVDEGHETEYQEDEPLNISSTAASSTPPDLTIPADPSCLTEHKDKAVWPQSPNHGTNI